MHHHPRHQERALSLSILVISRPGKFFPVSTKVAPFLSVKTKIRTGHLAELYVSRIVSLQDVSKTIVSDRGSLFTLNFGIVCKRLWELVFLSSQLIIFKLMAKRNEPTKFWKTCSVLVFFPMGIIGRNASHSPSFVQQ